VKSDTADASSASFLERNEFLIRRLHSLSGLVPVGAYMVVHLLTNASVLNGPATFQRSVYTIHSLGNALPLVEWVFIFIPLLFHAILGVLYIRGSLPNSSTYKYTNNVRYTLQRATGMIAFVFIMWHVFHMHGWFHADWWLNGVATPLGGAMFRPYNAASTGAEAMRMAMPLVTILYAIGVLSCVFHLANGIWTFGITWGVWTTPAAQRWATVACLVFGIGLGLVSMGALAGFAGVVDVKEARKLEDKMYEREFAAELELAKEANRPDPNEHKRYHPPKEHAAAPAHDASTQDATVTP
jgi:succinate dehydrogenase / fumarate reductase cytochrome b subunit